MTYGRNPTLTPTITPAVLLSLGRSELPEGLKALFRPMTVVVPDLVLICENFLMAQVGSSTTPTRSHPLPPAPTRSHPLPPAPTRSHPLPTTYTTHQGFEQAKILASKFFGLYNLLGSLLSKQMHYDWGLRSVKSVLYVAGAFKRASPDMDEQALLMRALRDFNKPKIISEDEVRKEENHYLKF